MVMQIFGGLHKMHYGLCENGEWQAPEVVIISFFFFF